MDQNVDRVRWNRSTSSTSDTSMKPVAESSSQAMEKRSSVTRQTTRDRMPGEGLVGNVFSSPTSSSKKRNPVYGDRFIPVREGYDLHKSFELMDEAGPSTPTRSKRKVVVRSGETDGQKEEANKIFNAVLRTELFGADSSLTVDSSSFLNSPNSSRYGLNSFATSSTSLGPSPTNTPNGNLFRFSSPTRKRTLGATGLDSPTHQRYSTSPIKVESQQLLLSPKKIPRTVSKVPFKVLDAPDLADDFYLNLVDWSSTNVLGVGLGSCVFLWSANTSQVKQLCDLSSQNDRVTSINWAQRGSQIAIGTNLGKLKIYDAERCKLIREVEGHSGRVGALAWNQGILTSGSRDRLIFHSDVRIKEARVARLHGHKQEVCGLKWSPDGKQLASGGNDNKLFVWDDLNSTPLHRFTEHTAAVKAIAWNPHQNGILASGGGTQDKKIRFWNTLTGSLLSEVDTGSQICNLVWSKNSNEIASTHGFSAGQVQNHICIWKYPSMQHIATLAGHTFRVLYLAMSPDGQTIVTGAGDETLRFWHAFPKSQKRKKQESALLNPFSRIR